MARFGRNVTPLLGRSKSYAPASQCSADRAAGLMLVSGFTRSDVKECRSRLSSALVRGSAGPGSPGERRGSTRGKEQPSPGTWLAGARSSAACLRQTDDCWVFPNWIIRKDTRCHHVNKNVRWVKAFVFAQKSAKCSVSLISCEGTEKENDKNEQGSFLRAGFALVSL